MSLKRPRPVASPVRARPVAKTPLAPPPPAPARAPRAKLKPSAARQRKASQAAQSARKALQIYERLHREYVKVASQDDARARELCAQHVSKIYAELHCIALELLLSVESEQELGGYRVLTFRGEASDRRCRLQQRLAAARKAPRGQRRDALAAALAALCCRLQKNWLAAYDEEVPARGYFAHALVDPESSFRIALKARPLRLASLLLTKEAPLGIALADMDRGGPFPKGHEKEPLGERQYGMQRVGLEGGYGEDQKERLGDLSTLPALRRLMGSDEKVLVLDVYCALAPKERVERHDLGGIIRAELQQLLRDAKRRGQAVVFVVGGEQPLNLAKKVYLQPCFTSIGGLQCGYFRWKVKDDALWEPPKLQGQHRVIFGLQLP